MPVRWKIDVENELIRATVSGEVSLSDILDAITDSASDPEFRRGFDVYSDHTAIRKAITSAQMHSIVARLESLSPSMRGARWAIVTSQPASYGMMRMLAVYSERIPIELRVFGCASEAESWLSSPKP